MGFEVFFKPLKIMLAHDMVISRMMYRGNKRRGALAIPIIAGRGNENNFIQIYLAEERLVLIHLMNTAK